MMHSRILLIFMLLILGGCKDDTATSKEVRIDREVERRVGVIKDELKVGQNRMHTIRVVVFVLLAGGSVALLVHLQCRRGERPNPTHERLPPVTHWQDHYAIPSTRVIDSEPEPLIRQRRNHGPTRAARHPSNSNHHRNKRNAPTSRA